MPVNCQLYIQLVDHPTYTTSCKSSIFSHILKLKQWSSLVYCGCYQTDAGMCEDQRLSGSSDGGIILHVIWKCPLLSDPHSWNSDNECKLVKMKVLMIYVLFYRVTFRELHTAYGRPILTDRNEWRHRNKIELENRQQPLISL